MGVRHSSKFSTQYYLSLTSEEQVQALEVWDKISRNIPFHNENIMQRFFGAYPEYRKYFIAITKCNASKLCEHPKVIRHWEQIIELLGFILCGVTNRRRCIEHNINYVALFHKDMNLDMGDFEKYTVVFIAYLNQEIYLSPTVEGLWTTFMSSIFRIMSDRMDKFRMMETQLDAQGNEIILTPENVNIYPARENISRFFRCKSNADPCLDFALPKSYNYHNREYWIERKEYWTQQIYWFNKETDEYLEKLWNQKMSARQSSCDEGNSHSHSTSHLNESIDTTRPIYVLNEDAFSNTLHFNKSINEHSNIESILNSSLSRREKKGVKRNPSVKYKNRELPSRYSNHSDKAIMLDGRNTSPEITSSMIGFLKDIEDEFRTELLNASFQSTAGISSKSKSESKKEENRNFYGNMNESARERRRKKKGLN